MYSQVETVLPSSSTTGTVHEDDGSDDDQRQLGRDGARQKRRSTTSSRNNTAITNAAAATGPVRRRSSAFIVSSPSIASTTAIIDDDRNGDIDDATRTLSRSTVVTSMLSRGLRRLGRGYERVVASSSSTMDEHFGEQYQEEDSHDDDIHNDLPEEADFVGTPIRRRSTTTSRIEGGATRDGILRRSMDGSENNLKKIKGLNDIGPTTTSDSVEQPHTPHPISCGDYLSVLYRYPQYRAYLLSHLCQHTGNWFVRIASILIVEELANPDNKGEVLSHMTLCRLLPNAVFAQFGGVLADQYDRRKLMILLDLLAGFIVLGYLLAIQQHSLPLFYGVTILRSACDATYFPVTVGIVPLLVTEPGDLQCAVTMNSWAWSIMAILGGVIAGSLAASIGLSTCYLIDFGTFWLSAVVLYCGVHGNFNVKTTTSLQQTTGSSTTEQSGGLPTDYALVRKIKNSYHVFKELAVYLLTCGFGMTVFLKSSASFIWGIEDIVLPEFATVFNEDGTEDEEVSSMHMGEAFSIVGIGCLVGPALINLITDAHRPYTLQRACLIGVGFLTSGWLFISQASTFPQFLAGTLWRTMGSGIVWVNSTLVLQTLVDKEILGRVIGLEFTLTQLLEASSAAVSGRLDDAGFSKSSLALFGALCGFIMLVFWGVYYALSLGAAQPRFNNNYEFDNPMKPQHQDIDHIGIEMMDTENGVSDDDAVNHERQDSSKRSQKVIVRL